MKRTIRFLVITSIFALIVFPKKADAYLDPGTGSYIIQVIVAVLFGGLFAIKTFWQQIKSFLSNLFSGKDKKKSEKPKDHDK